MSNDPNAKNGPDNPASTLESIERAGNEVSQRHELHSAGSQAGGTNPAMGAPPGGSANGGTAGGEIFSKSVQALVRAFDATMTRRLARAAWTLTQDKGFVQSLVEEASLTQEELSSIGELSSLVAQKYSLLTSYAPEVGLACIVVGYGSRMFHATRRIEDLARQKKGQTHEPKQPEPGQNN